MEKIKIIATFRSFPTGKRNFQKKLKKLKKIITDSSKAKIGGKMLRKREIKIITPFRSFPTGKRKFQKNSKKIQKIEKYHYGFIPSQNMLEKSEKVRK